MLNVGYIIRVIASLILLLGLISCERNTKDRDDDYAESRTVLMYIAADNNGLSSEAESKIAKVLEGWKSHYGRLLFFVDCGKGSPSLMEAKNDGGHNVLDTLISYEEQNSVSADLFARVLGDVKRMASAKSYGMMFFSHATGWLPRGTYSNPRQGGVVGDIAIGYRAQGDKTNGCAVEGYKVVGGGAIGGGVQRDGANGGGANGYQVQRHRAVGSGAIEGGVQRDGAIEGGARQDGGTVEQRSIGSDGRYEMELVDFAAAIEDDFFDFILFESCFMSGIEVAYQLRNKSRFIVASAAEIVRPGFYVLYGRFMPLLYRPQADLTRVAELYYQHTSSLSGSFKSSTISVLDCAQLEALAQVTASITSKMGVQTEWGSEQKEVDLDKIQNFDRRKERLFFDLADYVHQIGTEQENSDFDKALRKCVIYKANTDDFMLSYGGYEIRSHCGLTTYIRQSEFEYLNSAYTELDWAQKTLKIQ